MDGEGGVYSHNLKYSRNSVTPYGKEMFFISGLLLIFPPWSVRILQGAVSHSMFLVN